MTCEELHTDQDKGTNIISWNNGSKIETTIFCVVLLELFIMGSGRVLEIGPLTFRMLLFAGCTLIVCHNFLSGKKKISEFTLYFTCGFFILQCLALFLGYASSSDQSLIMEDIKPILYFMMLIYFEMTITDMRRVRLVTRIVKYSSISLATIYIATLLLTYAGIIDFKFLYELMSSSSDFMFRGESNDIGIFYKGFLYLCIGLLFHLFGNGKKSTVLILLLVTAIILTFTRGFILAAVPVILVGYYLTRKNVLAAAGLSTVLIALGSLVIFKVSTLLGNKMESDLVRVVTARQVIDEITLKSALIGHGFGQGVPERPVHMETSLLEIFHKQGLLGLSFWLLLLYFIVSYYKQTYSKHNNLIAIPFMLSSIFIYLQSITNPYMNNPIGMSFLLISLVTLRLLALTDGNLGS